MTAGARQSRVGGWAAVTAGDARSEANSMLGFAAAMGGLDGESARTVAKNAVHGTAYVAPMHEFMMRRTGWSVDEDSAGGDNVAFPCSTNGKRDSWVCMARKCTVSRDKSDTFFLFVHCVSLLQPASSSKRRLAS